MIVCLQFFASDKEKTKLEILHQEYSGLMYHIAYKYLRNRHDAEDAVQHAFLKIAENSSKISDLRSPKTKRFIVTIIENRVIDILRVKGRHRTSPLDEMCIPTAELPDVDDPLARCMLKLSAQQREVLWLKYYFGYDLHEIAAMLEISLAWAQKLDQRAKKKLERLLNEEGIEV